MEMTFNNNVLRFGIAAVFANIFGVIFSGLVFPVLTMVFCPQPLWEGPELFIKSFHPLQMGTFFCGFFLVIGSLLTFVALTFVTPAQKKIVAVSALAINILFTVVVFLNYIIQITYVPYLATHNPPETSSLLAAFTMANPGSFAWTLEMWGWGGVGLSFIFMAFIFDNDRVGRVLIGLFVGNGVSSLIAAIMTSIEMRWLFSAAGFASLITWNLLVLLIDFYLLLYFRKKQVEVV
jgi:hypothetical protein